MSKIMTKTPKARLVLLNSINSKWQRCVYIQIPFSGNVLRKSTDIWVSPKEWDDKTESITSSTKEASLINTKLSLQIEKIRSQLLKLDLPIRIETVQEILGNRPKNKELPISNPDFIEYAHKVNDIFHNLNKYGYTTWYNKKQSIDAFKFYIEHYLKADLPLLNDLKLSLFDGYIQYRIKVKKNTSMEGINKTLVPLYTALEYAVKNGDADNSIVGPIMGNYVSVRKTDYNPDEYKDEKIKYLTPKQMKQFYKYCQGVKSENARRILDMFFFSFFACGMRLSDIITLEWKNIDFDNKSIEKVQVKTKKKGEVGIPLNDNALEILNRWKGYNLNDRFVFNRLPKSFDISDQKLLFMSRNIQDKSVNRILSTVGRNAKMPVDITMHVARHSFAVMYINNGVSLHMLSKLLGHSSLAATEKTYARFLREKVNKDMENLNNKVF